MVDFSSDQHQALDQIVRFIEQEDRPFYVLNGLAGTGKTTVLAEIAREFRLPMCAFTGKAASVLFNKTHLMATTIHAYIYDVERVLKDGVWQPYFTDKYEPGDLYGQMMLLDECSMVNRPLAQDMLRTGMRIVACGDPGQLPPVFGEQFFSVPDFTLIEPHRQALESPIIRQAYQVRNGIHYQPDGEGFQVCQTIPREQLLQAGAVIVYTNKSRRDLTILMRDMKGYARKFPQPGEPVMCLKNFKDAGLFNGGVYTLKQPFEPGDSDIVVEVDGVDTCVRNVEFECIPSSIDLEVDEPNTRFDFGYVITCHKAQGSEWENVIILDEYPLWREDRNKWLYTAITRASQKVSIIPYY